MRIFNSASRSLEVLEPSEGNRNRFKVASSAYKELNPKFETNSLIGVEA